LSDDRENLASISATWAEPADGGGRVVSPTQAPAYPDGDETMAYLVSAVTVTVTNGQAARIRNSRSIDQHRSGRIVTALLECGRGDHLNLSRNQTRRPSIA
jgi:hypothetical protein